MSFIILIILSYLLGSIPFGVLITKYFSKEDLRKKGSGNIGATNVVRVAGKKLGILTFILDSIKGIVAIILARHIFQVENADIIGLIAIAAVMGHMFPLWLKGKGGKGVATTFAIFILLEPLLGFSMVFAWIFVYYISHIVSLASIIAMFIAVIYSIIGSSDYVIAILLLAVFVIIKHKDNIIRICQGTEFSFKK